MKDMSLRNVLLLLAAVIAALLILGFVSTLLNQLIPITIALVAGVVLGRMSVNIDLRAIMWNLIRRQKPTAENKPESKEQPVANDDVGREVEAIKQRIADTESEQEEKAEITDFDIKSEEEILAEARQREAEIAQKTAEYDPSAALEERRRRLLGDQADGLLILPMGTELTTYVAQVTRHLPAGNTFACLQALKHLLEQTDSSLRVSAHFEQSAMPALIVYREGIATGYVFIGAETISQAQDVLPNVLQTDYLAFHHNEQSARLGTVTNGQFTPEPNTKPVTDLLSRFINTQIKPVQTADDLAQQLGKSAALLRDGLAACLDESAPDESLMAQWRVWQQTTGWTRDQFADEYAQAIAFSLLSARLRHDGPARQGLFTLRDVTWDLPPTNPFMRDLLREVKDDRVKWRTDALVALLAVADITAIRDDIDHRARNQDPLGPLYQTFMHHYAPDAPITQTAEAFVIYLTEAVHYLLRKRFKHTFGLADHAVQIIDPATADGTALFFAIQRIGTVLRRSQQLDGAWDAYTADSLLPHIHGLNESLAAYALTHLKISLQLDTSGYTFDNVQRLQVYLTGKPIEVAEESLARLIRDELRVDLSTDTPLVAILSGVQHGEPYLQMAKQAIEAAQGGVMALALPADFTTGSHYTIQRDALLHFYSDLYILQLPEMTIGLFARRIGWLAGVAGRVRYATAPALDWLATHAITSTPWHEIRPQQPDYRFVPTANHALQPVQKADSGWEIAQIMPEHTTGLSEASVDVVASTGSMPILYHPFDLRYIANLPAVSSLRHMLRGDNLALCVDSSNIFCASVIPHEHLLGPTTQVYPLYVYPETARLVADSPFAPGLSGRRPNFDAHFIVHLANHLDMIFLPDGRGDLRETFGPEDIFNTVYALLNSLGHVPENLRFPKETRQFSYLARRGRDLVRYHRLHRPHNWPLITGFHGSGNNRVDPGYPRYLELAGETGGRIYINKDKFFTGIERRQWEACTGGVRVLHSWLTARADYTLGWHDLLHYQRVVVALTRSTNTLDKINKRLLVD